MFQGIAIPTTVRNSQTDTAPLVPQDYPCLWVHNENINVALRCKGSDYSSMGQEPQLIACKGASIYYVIIERG